MQKNSIFYFKTVSAESAWKYAWFHNNYNKKNKKEY